MRKRSPFLRALVPVLGLLGAAFAGASPARADGEFCILPPTASGVTGSLTQLIWKTMNLAADQQIQAGAIPLQANGGPQPPVTIGTLNAMVILVDFEDTQPIRPNLQMRNLFFGDAEEAPNGSVRQFYLENSYGKLTIDGRIFGNPRASVLDHPDPARQVKWLRMPQAYNYYAFNSYGLFGADPHNSRQLVRDALREVQNNYPTLDWAQFDGNGDGYLDLLYIVHAGPGAEGTGDPNQLWSHRSQIEDTVVGTGPNGLQIKARDYAMGSEDSNVGTHSHEIGHVLGLPDLYVQPQGQGVGIGFWSVMGHGGSLPFDVPLDVQGQRPTHFDPWCKIQLGWLSPTSITRNTENITLPPVQTSPTVLKIPANGNNPLEYFLVENRPKLQGTFDAPRLLNFFDTFNQTDTQAITGGLPGSGVVIYHIDERRGTNDDRGHLLIAVEEAGAGEINPVTGRAEGSNLLLPFNHPLHNFGDPGDPFGNSNKNFTNNTTPTSYNYDGSDSGVRVLNITPPPLASGDLDGNGEPDEEDLWVVKADNANATLSVKIASIIGSVFDPNSTTAPTINTRLLNEAGQPIENANKEVSGTEFSFFNLDPGNYQVEITTNQHIPQVFPVTKGAGPVQLRIFLSPQLSSAQFSAGWNLIGFPLDFSGAKISEVFNLPNLKSYGWDGNEYVSDPVVKAGEAYWVFVTDPALMRVVRPGRATSPEQNQTIPVRKGWNLVSNPFPRAVTWDPASIQIQLTNGTRLTLDQAMTQDLAANYGWAFNAGRQAYRQIRRGDPVPIYQGFWYYSNVAGNIIVFPAPLTPPG